MPDKFKQPKYPIKLGKSMSDLAEGPVTPGEKSDEIMYPGTMLEWERPYNFPDEGTITFRFKKKSEETRKKPGGKTMQRVELDFVEIVDTEAKKGGEDKEESTGDALDKEVKKLAKKKVDKTEDEDEGY